MAEPIHSTMVKGIGNAGFDLIVRNAEHLIKYIYNHVNTAPYSSPEIRVGLVVKILLRSNETYCKDLLQPVIDDISTLMSQSSSSSNPERHKGLSMELSLVNKFIELDDSISLNTTNPNPNPNINPKYNVETNLLGDANDYQWSYDW